jgi:hypothetical protein
LVIDSRLNFSSSERKTLYGFSDRDVGFVDDGTGGM